MQMFHLSVLLLQQTSDWSIETNHFQWASPVKVMANRPGSKCLSRGQKQRHLPSPPAPFILVLLLIIQK
jgi:hypothetical protein